MKLITREIDYAVRALKYLAENKNGRTVPVPELVEELGITRPFSKEDNAGSGQSWSYQSYKGNNGGFGLVKKPEDIYSIDLSRDIPGRFQLK